MPKSTTRKLTALEQQFAREYIVDLNASAALVRAGSRSKHPDAQASQMMQRPHVQTAIQEAMAKRVARTEITQDKVLKDLEETRKGAMAKEDFGSALKAIQLQGKHIGMFGDKVEHNHTGSVTLQVITGIDRALGE